MEKQDIIMFLWLVPTLAFMTTTRIFLPPPLDAMAGTGGFAIMFVGIFFQNMVAKDMVTNFAAWVATIRPRLIRAQFLYKNVTSTPLGDDYWLSVLHLGMPYIHPKYGKLKHCRSCDDPLCVGHIYIYHEKPLKERIKLARGKVLYLALTVIHNEVDYPVLYEIPIPWRDHGSLYPRYVLVEAGKDFPKKGDEVLNHVINHIEQTTPTKQPATPLAKV